MNGDPLYEMVELAARAIADLRMCEKQGNVVPCASCQNVRGYNDDVGCMTLARAAIAAIEVVLLETKTMRNRH